MMPETDSTPSRDDKSMVMPYAPTTYAPPRCALATHDRRGWLISALLLVLGVVYISAFWGKGAQYLPAPLNRWTFIYQPIVKPWWNRNVLTTWSSFDRHLMLWVTTNFTLGMLAPAILLRLFRLRLRDVGIGLPNTIGRHIIVVGVVLSIPFGIWLSLADPKLGIQKGLTFFHFAGGLSMIPEHFLICGTYVALMLPGRKLPNPAPMAPFEGPPLRRWLRRLGLAQPSFGPETNRPLAWFGLTGTSLAAVTISGLLFGMVHIGKGPTELALSFPGGVAVAYMTLRAHSIWPAIVSHWAMNLIPMGLWALVRS